METQSEASAGAAQADRRQPVPPAPGATAFKCGRPVTLLHQTGRGKSTVAVLHRYMSVARLPPQIALSGESATTVTERSWEYLWLTPGRSLLLRLFVSSILRFSEDVWFLHACKIECLLPQSPLMGGPRVGATSNPLPGFERRGPGSIYPLGPGTFIRTDHLTQQPSIGRRRSTGPSLDINVPLPRQRARSIRAIH